MRVRLAVMLAFVALLAAPAAQACSLAYIPLSNPQFADGLWYESGGGSLRHVVAGIDDEIVAHTFLDYIRLDGGRILMTYQVGLGADCSGDDYTELLQDGRSVWRRDGYSRLIRTGGEPMLWLDHKLWRLDGTELKLVDDTLSWDDDLDLLGWTEEGVPVLQDNQADKVHIGNLAVHVEDGGAVVGAGAGRIAILEQVWDESGNAIASLRLTEVHRGDVRTVSWPSRAGTDYSAQVVWADGWVVLARGGYSHGVQEVDKVFYVQGDKVTDLGVEDPVAVAARDDQPVVFTFDYEAKDDDGGYVVFAGTVPVEAYKRVEHGWDGPVTWTQVPPSADPEGVDGPSASEGKVWDVPGTPAVLLLAALAIAAFARRR